MLVEAVPKSGEKSTELNAQIDLSGSLIRQRVRSARETRCTSADCERELLRIHFFVVKKILAHIRRVAQKLYY